MFRKKSTFFESQNNYKILYSSLKGHQFKDNNLENIFKNMHEESRIYTLYFSVFLSYILNGYAGYLMITIEGNICNWNYICYFLNRLLGPITILNIVLSILMFINRNKDYSIQARIKGIYYILTILLIHLFSYYTKSKPSIEIIQSQIRFIYISRVIQLFNLASFISANLRSYIIIILIDSLIFGLKFFIFRYFNTEECIIHFIFCLFLGMTLIIIGRYEITLRKYMRERLNQSFHSKYYYKYLNNMAPCLISILDDEVFFLNKTFKEKIFSHLQKFKHTGTSLKELTKGSNGYNIDTIFNALINPKTKKSLKDYHTLIQKKYTENKKELKKKFNSYFQIKVSENKIIDKYFKIELRITRLPNGKYVFNYIVNDITDIKYIEKSQSEINLKENLFAFIAHEIKTPLVSINILLQELDNNIKNDSNNDMINNKLVHYSQMLSDSTIYLIDDVIHYSAKNKITGKKLNTSNKFTTDSTNLCFSTNINNKNSSSPLNLKSIINDTFDLLTCKLKYGTGKRDGVLPLLEFDESLGNIEILSNDKKIRQIFYNIISNSIKFTKSGFIKIKAFKTLEENIIIRRNSFKNKRSSIVDFFEDCFCSSNSSDSALSLVNNDKKHTLNAIKSIMHYDTIVISVEDTGKGFINNVNKKNSRLEMPTSLNYNTSSGLGIGLKIVESLCNELGITFDIKSNLNKGTIATFKISYDFSTEENVKDELDSYEINTEKSICNINSEGKEENEILILENKSSSESKNTTLIQYNEIASNSQFSPIKSNSSLIRPNQSSFSINVPTHFKLDNILNNKNNDKKNSIIICDDSELIRNSHQRLFNNILGDKFNIIACADGIDILKLIMDDQAEGNKISYVFTDENMDYMNGSKAAETLFELKKENRIKDVQIFSVTAFEDEETRKKITKSGINDIFSKPLNKQIILGCIEKYKII